MANGGLAKDKGSGWKKGGEGGTKRSRQRRDEREGNKHVGLTESRGGTIGRWQSADGEIKRI